MGRPKGWSPPPCSECGNRGRHKVTCSKSSTKVKEPERKPLESTVRPYTRKEVDPAAIVEGGLPIVDSYVSLKQNHVCACGEVLEMGKQHWVKSDDHKIHLCMEHAGDLVRGSKVNWET